MWRAGILASTLFLASIVTPDSWQEQPFQEWSPELARTILTDSPWARVFAIQQEGSDLSAIHKRPDCETCPSELAVPGAPEPTTPDLFAGTRHFLVRFQTALPVRMALARFAMLTGDLGAKEAEEYVRATPFGDHIVIAVWVPPGESTGELNQLDGDVPDNQVYLRLRRSKRKIPVKQIVTPFQAGGREAYFVFPRLEGEQELVLANEKEVEFFCRLNRALTIRQKFKLKEMLFGETLAL